MTVSGAGWKPSSVAPLYVRSFEYTHRRKELFSAQVVSSGLINLQIWQREQDVGRKCLVLGSRGAGRHVEGGGMKGSF